MEDLVQLLKEKQLTISSCESLTAGLFSATMASVPSTSSVLCGGVSTYMTRTKSEVVGVEESIIEEFGVISEQCASSMADHIRKLMKSDIGVSCTGNAGPSVMEGKELGCVYIGVSFEDYLVTRELKLDGDRNEIRKKTVDSMCDFVAEVIRGKGELNGKD